MLLGEYPWAESVPDTEVWSQGRDSAIPKPVTPSAARYMQEASGYDCSIDDTISIQLPCPWLVQQMRLKWEGAEGQFVDASGRLVAFDPSVEDQGPRAVRVVKRSARRVKRMFYWASFKPKRRDFITNLTLRQEQQIVGLFRGHRC